MRNPFARRPAPAAPPSGVPEAELRARVRALVRPGFHTRAEAVAAACEAYADEPGVPVDAVERVVGEEWSAREAELAAADGTGDFGRLEQAFAALAEQGVLARMAFSCCQTCGTDEIGAERTPLADPPAGRYPWAEWAYTFFHAQDAERLAEPDPTLLLSFSAFMPAPDSDPADVAAGRAGDVAAMERVVAHTDAAVGREVVTALVDAGLTVTWDGTNRTRIAVAVPAWRKPLPTDGPAAGA